MGQSSIKLDLNMLNVLSNIKDVVMVNTVIRWNNKRRHEYKRITTLTAIRTNILDRWYKINKVMILNLIVLNYRPTSKYYDVVRFSVIMFIGFELRAVIYYFK